MMKSTCIILSIVFLFGLSAFADNSSSTASTPSATPLVCPQCGVWQLSYSEPDGLVGDNVFVDDHQIVIPGCGVFTYEVEKAKTKVKGEDSYIYDLSLSLLRRKGMSLICEGGLGDKWKMDVKVHGRGSADLVLSKFNEKQPMLQLEGWNIDREGPCDWGGGRETARCSFMRERLIYKTLLIKVEQAYQVLLKNKLTEDLPTFNAARFSTIVSKFCENKEKDSGGAEWPYAWAYTCKNRILGAKLEEFSAWQACMEKNKNTQKTCKFPTESFDRSPKSETER